MIQLLSKNYQQSIAYFFLLVFFVSVTLPARAGGGGNDGKPMYTYAGASNFPNEKHRVDKRQKVNTERPFVLMPNAPKFIGGPSQPEMASFKSVGTDNMVNLFTGDFNYNIPLLDVGGYPVNIYYDGNIGMEQEASWVGLGWNINPGSITRNMRGVPDDFDGTDTMVENQNIKPNTTWGGHFGGDMEFCGDKTLLNKILKGVINGSSALNLGVSFNNYLGPALDMEIKGATGINLGKTIRSEKSSGTDSANSLSLGFNGAANFSSRSGLSLSGSVSLTTKSFQDHIRNDYGLSVGTSYNSRVGIKGVQITGQEVANDHVVKKGFNQNIQTQRDLFGATISFSRPSYVPTIRMPMTNTAWSGHFQIGAVSLFGLHGSLEAEVYKQSSEISQPQQLKPLVGYMYYQNAVNNQDAVMDFSRLQDREVTPNTSVISAPQYTFDVFSIQGEGTGGTVRAYRTDFGYVRDNSTTSTDNTVGAGLDIALVGHIGGNFNIVKTPTHIGKWDNGNNLTLGNGLNFQQGKDLHELVYFRNPGESTVIDEKAFDRIGGVDLVRYQIGGIPSSPTIEPVLNHYNAKDATVKTDGSNNPVITNMLTTPAPSGSSKRSQIVTFLIGDEAKFVGLDTTINNYSGDNVLKDQPDAGDPSKHNYYLNYSTISRVGGYRKGHHISQINVTESDGKRYVYGIPVYNISQTDFTFSVKNPGGVILPDVDKVNIQPEWMTTLMNEDGIDGYYQSTRTPAYAHSFLLSGLLSPDYVDVTGDGITEDDLGNAVKFNYSLYMNSGANGQPAAGHRWRTPLSAGHEANFNPGNRSEKKDDKGIVSYGEREQWYLHSLESKTMIAIFTLANRDDGKGAVDFTGGINAGDNTVKRLDHIDLYNKADLRRNGLAGAKPIKTVHFVYSYMLCKGTPDNPSSTAQSLEGKLTLESIYFTFNGQTRADKTQYKFAYTSGNSSDNPNYLLNASDRWGTYKPALANPQGSEPSNLNPAKLTNKEYPYSLQTSTDVSAATINANAGAWALKKILLPSGSQIQVTYESDDYAYVQDKPAAQMMQVVGFGTSKDDYANNSYTGNLFDFKSDGLKDNYFVFVRVPAQCSSASEVYQKYLRGYNSESQLAFKFAIRMPKGEEYVTSYAHLELDPASKAVLCGTTASANSSSDVIWLQLKDVDGYSPLTVTATEYLREQLPGQAHPGYDMSDFNGGAVEEIATMIGDMISSLGEAFKKPIDYFREQGMAKYIARNSNSPSGQLKCYVRLNNPTGVKYGGGSRVKKIELIDNWDKMTSVANGANGQYKSSYGQVYDYTTEETLIDGTERTISSGVASYEPAIGAEENPFTEIVQYKDRLPLGPASYGSAALPILDGFYPAPTVGYSKVTVRSLADDPSAIASNGGKKPRSGIGRQVTEFYTAKDFPSSSNYTNLDASSNVQEHDASLLEFFYKHAEDYKALSQGFIVTTNDMHGKLKSQSSYAANDDKTRINYTENFYTNTGVNGLGDKFDFVDGTSQALITKGNMGVDVELMTDTREFSVTGSSFELQAQVDLFPVVLPIWLLFPWPVFGRNEDIYRAVTATKVVSYHSVLDKVLVIDKGSQVITQNLLRDANTGEVLVNQTNNEFNQPVYSTAYPAYWAYSGMGPAYQNIDAVYSGVSFSDGRINKANGSTSGTQVPTSIFESGDELLITHAEGPSSGCDVGIASKGTSTDLLRNQTDIIWAFKANKYASTSTDPTQDLIFIDAAGKPYTNSNVNFRIIRSGKRNLLGEHVQAVTNSRVSPIPATVDAFNHKYLTINNNSNVINASAIEYKEKWQTDKDEIGTFITVPDGVCDTKEQPSCDNTNTGLHLEASINPYRKGLLGNFKPDRNLVYYGGRAESAPAVTTQTNLPKNGFLDTSFALYWSFNGQQSLQALGTHDVIPSSNWVFKSRTTRVNARGLELETVDALNINTAAQYGYSKNLPTAITNNAAYSESVYEGFEDNAYTNRLNAYHNIYDANSNTAPLICSNSQYIDFSSMGNSQIINTDGQSFNAHTGKYVLGINAGSTAVKTISVADMKNTNFSLNTEYKTEKTLTDLGGNITNVIKYPSSLWGTTGIADDINHISAETNFSGGGYSATIVGNAFEQDSHNQYYGGYNYTYSINTSHYINVSESGNFNILLEINNSLPGAEDVPIGTFVYDIGMNVIRIHDVINNVDVAIPQIAINSRDFVLNFAKVQLYLSPSPTIFLCKGIYQIYTNFGFNYQAPPSAKSPGSAVFYFGITKATPSTGIVSNSYKSLNTTNGCTHLVPIKGLSTMLHPSFTIPPAKKMVFSAWVREDGQAANQTSYNNNHVQIGFDNTTTNDVTLSPTGPVIDGWQRYEGYFSAPTGAANMNVSFVNSSNNNKVYFDDIRIHPYNANMKSYVYDPINQRLIAQLDANNYASYYEYDEEGTLIRTKAETVQGIKTINETRSAKQKKVTELQ